MVGAATGRCIGRAGDLLRAADGKDGPRAAFPDAGRRLRRFGCRVYQTLQVGVWTMGRPALQAKAC